MEETIQSLSDDSYIPELQFLCAREKLNIWIFFVTLDMYSSHSLNGTGTVSCLVDNTSAANTSFGFMKAEGIPSGCATKKDKSKNNTKVKASPCLHWGPSSPSPSRHQSHLPETSFMTWWVHKQFCSTLLPLLSMGAETKLIAIL